MKWIAALFVAYVYVCLLQCDSSHAEPEPEPLPISIVPRAPYYLPPYQQNQCCGQNYYNPYNYICGARPCSVTIVINKKPEDDTTDTEDSPTVTVDVTSENDDDGAIAVASVSVDADGDGDAEATAAAIGIAGTDPLTNDDNNTPDAETLDQPPAEGSDIVIDK